ncbi:hypothetical protein [Sphingobium abikonense]|uniref:hypothetical protein n=1 Tax=Sphingobium abikonense TaxID=86193 RepID=UPI0035130FF1
MDKSLLFALGVGVMIVAAVDQGGDSESGETVAEAGQNDPQNLAPQGSGAAGMGWSVDADRADTGPAALPPPVNPIPRAEDLGGKVISDRFQADG